MIRYAVPLLNSWELIKNTDFSDFIYKINKNKRWIVNFKSERFTAIELDVKDQYNFLKHQDIMIALDWMIKFCTSRGYLGLYLSTLKIHKKLDRLIKTDNIKRKMRFIPFHIVRAYILWEISHAYFYFDNTLFRQTFGIPQGAQCSPPLASIDSIYKEHMNNNIWKDFPYQIEICRSRDDTRIICGARLSKFEIDNIVKLIQNFYGADLSIELVNFSYTNFRFLDYRVNLDSYLGKLITSDNNKVIESVIDNMFDIIRFPSYKSAWNDQIFRSIVYSQTLNTVKKSNHDNTLFIDLMCLFREFIFRDYPILLITRSLRYINNPVVHSCKVLLIKMGSK